MKRKPQADPKAMAPRIRIQIEGGLAHFPGLARPREIDATQLSDADAKTLRELIERSHLRSLPPVVGALPRGAADHRSYTLTLIEHGKEHRVRIIEPIQDEALARLVEFARARAVATDR